MSNRHVQKMLRQMASGEPVQVTSAMASMKKLARLAFIAQQFGYEYADVRQGGPQGNGFVMLIVPDPSPQARTRAEQNRVQYPSASDGGALPALVPDEVELLKARIAFDLAARYTEKQLTVIMGVGFSTLAVCLGLQLGADTTAVVVAGIAWAALMAFVPVGLVVNRRYRAKHVARLQAAGFTPVTERSGRLRYLPRGGQLPGHGNPFAGGA
uniref:Integral membrane protein n=1 Tax=Streptomyces sp. NBC_01393 TaxID=2903851 RepID=A0AAU3I9J1_9ACTN